MSSWLLYINYNYWHSNVSPQHRRKLTCCLIRNCARTRIDSLFPPARQPRSRSLTARNINEMLRGGRSFGRESRVHVAGEINSWTINWTYRNRACTWLRKTTFVTTHERTRDNRFPGRPARFKYMSFPFENCRIVNPMKHSSNNPARQIDGGKTSYTTKILVL